jgi:hypothetical protein
MSWRNTSDCRLSPPSHFFFVRKRKKLCWQKNPLANDVKKHVGFIFSPAGEIHTVFRRSDSRTKKGIFKFATKCDISAPWCFIIVLPTLVSIGISCIPRRFDVTNATNCSAGEGAISPPAIPDAGKPRDDHTWRCRQCIALEYVRTQSTLERHTEQQKSEAPKLALYAVRFQ